MPHVSGLFIYPVKSLRGIEVKELAVDELGPVGDRRFLVVDESGRFLTQRSHPRMALVSTGLTADTLTLSADGARSVRVPRYPDPAAPLRSVTVWKNEGLQAEDCGDEPAAWLSAFLATPCRLVRIGGKFIRPLKPAKARPGDVISFADGYPFLIISEASLADLNDRLQENGAEPVPMNRFRPNLVVSGCPPFAEDNWARFRIGPAAPGDATPPSRTARGEGAPAPDSGLAGATRDSRLGVIFRAGGPCARCIVTTTDQLTGERTGPEPLRTLATFRRDPADPTDVNFGQNLIHETKSGNLRPGDEVVLL